jgi:hypothetical protein
MAAFLYPLFTVLNLGLLIWSFRLFQRNRSIYALSIMVVIAGLVYDNGVIALGWAIGEGSLLLEISRPRFLFHALLTPLFIVCALDMAARGGVGWAQRRSVQTAAWIAAFALIAFGVFRQYLSLNLVPNTVWGVLRYTEAHTSPPIAAILTIIVMIGIGAALWRKTGFAWLCLGAVIMFLGAAVPTRIVGPSLGNAVEIVLCTALLMTEVWLQRAVQTRPQSAPVLQSA